MLVRGDKRRSYKMIQCIKLIELSESKTNLDSGQGSVRCFLDQCKNSGVYTCKDISSIKSP